MTHVIFPSEGRRERSGLTESILAQVDLIAFCPYGRFFVSDILFGATADKVRRAAGVPVLLLKVKTDVRTFGAYGPKLRMGRAKVVQLFLPVRALN